MTTSILIALSRTVRPVIRATLPIGYRVHATWFQSFYAPDYNQAIRRMISYHSCVLSFFKLMTSYYPFATVVGMSANKLVGSAYRKLMPHPLRLFGLRHSFNRQPTDTMPT